MSDASSCTDSVFEADVIDSSVIDEGVFNDYSGVLEERLRLQPLKPLRVVMDRATPPQARLTMLAALTYLLIPTDLIPDFLPIAGFSDDLVALTAVIGLCSQHITPEIRLRAQRRLDRWFPLGRS